MSRDLILTRSRSSSRVRQLSAAAIRVVVYRRCSQSLSTTEAELLARNLTPSEAVERFRRQSEIPRGGMTSDQLRSYRTYLVAADAIEESAQSGAPVESRDREMVDKIRADQAAIASIRNSQQDLEQLSGQLERAGVRRRHFVRKADRLWAKQRSLLRAEIYDSERCDDAVSNLAALYTEAYRAAIEMADIDC